ncbi:MAG: SIR2 family protein [Gemmatimonadaceae bacterium]
MFVPPQSLIDAVRDKKLVPFVGAGISVGAVVGLPSEQRFPDWSGLILRLAERLENEGKAAAAAAVHAALPDTMAAAQIAVDSLGRPFFLDEMRRAFGRERAPVGADLSAVQALWRLRAPFVMTTNYDHVLEWPWDTTSIQRIHNDDPSYLQSLDDEFSKLRLWYLHGSIERVDTIILTSRQYLKLYPDGSPKRVEYDNAFKHFDALLADRSFLFVGFSLTEPVLRKKLEDVLESTGYTATIKYLLVRAGEADDARKRDFFDKYHVQVLEFENFGGPMVAAIDAIGRAAWPNAPSVPAEIMTSEMKPLVETLLEKVAGLALPPVTVARAYNASKPAAWEPALIGGDAIAMLRDAVVRLGGALTPAPGGPPPLLEFVSRIGDDAMEPWLGRLKAWLDSTTEQLSADVAARDALRAALARARDTDAAERVQVLVRIRCGAGAASGWIVHAWSWAGTDAPASLFGPEGRAYAEGSSGEVVYDLVDELEARNANPDLTSIAFAVPSALAWQPIHAWTLPASVANDPPIGATYTVTVRPLERLERPPLVRRRLKRAWEEFKKHAADMLAVIDPAASAPPNRVAAFLLDLTAATRRDLASRLDAAGARCVVLRDAPSATSLAHLSAVVDTMTPAIVWSQDGAGDAAAVAAIRDLLQSASLGGLPGRVRDERRAAFLDETGTHRGMSLSLVWDDADYVPPEQDGAKARLDII